MQKLVKNLQAHLDTLMAIEVLDYHNRNFLSADLKTINEEKRNIIRKSMELSESIEKAAYDLTSPKSQAGDRVLYPGGWVSTKDRLPEIGKLVYTRSKSGKIGAYTRFESGWSSFVSTDNEAIVEWYEQPTIAPGGGTLPNGTGNVLSAATSQRPAQQFQ